MTQEDTASDQTNFIADEIDADIAAGRYSRPICTRFPPEPNGYMHLGHAKACTINFDLAERYDGLFNLRMDDTNPTTEEHEYAEAMAADVAWLLERDLGDRVFYASDYFDQLYAYAEQLVASGDAFVDDLTLEQIREHRGDYHRAGKPSPYRERSVDENMTLLRQMKAGELPPGKCVLRAKIDPNSPNMNLRDPLIYRIMDAEHYRAGKWHIYPLYDYAHPLSDAIEGVTHSICGKEFENHRPLYDWFLEKLGIEEPPRQIEFAEIGVAGVVLGKRHMRRLVSLEKVSGWDDPRMPTMRGMRRRGFTPAAIRDFCRSLGVSNSGSPGEVEVARLDHYVRKALNDIAPRVMAVLDPIKLVLENYPEDQVDELEVPNLPDDPSSGTRMRPFSREIYLERDDFMEDPPKKFHRLAPGKEVRLRYGYLVTCTEVVRDAEGKVTELRGTCDMDSKGGNAPDGRKVRGTLHWVSAKHALPAEVRLFDPLFADSVAEFDGEEPIEKHLNPDSLVINRAAFVEPSLSDLQPGDLIQFERVGYFSVDPDSKPGALVFNRVVGLRDTKFRKIFKQ